MTEVEMLERLAAAQRVFLLEPPYKRKYPPLGLAKIATYCRAHGAEVRFGRQYDGWPCDLICVTSLFTTDSGKVGEAVGQAQFLSGGAPVLLGGVYASLMAKHAGTTGADVFAGYSQTLDQCVPAYDFDWGLEAPWDTFSFVFTSRGCPNRCAYCAVHRIEADQWLNPTWRDHILDDKPNAMISDNNLSAAPQKHLQAVIGFLAEKRKRVVFDNGFDCKHITPEMAQELARLKYTRSGMRLAFDRIEEDGVFQPAVQALLDAGVPKSQIMVYVLFNFNDTPQQAHYRMSECVRLGVRPYPQQFTPLNQTTRTEHFVGKHWTAQLARVFRHYWLMAGIYTKTPFEEFAKELPDRAEGKRGLRLDAEDWAAWYGTEDVADTPHDGQPRGGATRLRWTRPENDGWWATEPDVGRVAHGIPSRVDRLRGLGNAVVPQVAEYIGRVIMEAEHGG